MKKISVFLVLLSLLGVSCARQVDLNRIVIWHQMRVDERLVLDSQIKKFMELHPGVRVEEVYKETEELRSGYIIAAIAGQGPDLVYGPSDQVGPFQVMNIIKPLEHVFDSSWLASFNPKALTWYKGHLYQIADKLGNHLTLVYNKKIVSTPPTTDVDLIKLGEELTHPAANGKSAQYGLVWNYTEPFFYVPFLAGFGGWVLDSLDRPTLDTQANINALKFIRDLRDKYKIIPAEADYNVADALFKDGNAAMIINGDWSWAGYVKAGIDIGISPLPKIVSTGLWCSPMVAPKGYSINVNVPEEKMPLIKEFLEFINSPENQLETAKIVNTMPTRTVLYSHPFITSNPIMMNSRLQIDLGRPMPVVPELRAVWDAMRPSYQAVLGGSMTPEAAAKEMQAMALQKIRDMNE